MAIDEIHSDPSARAEPAASVGADANGELRDAEANLWQQFASASTPEAYYHSWLALQCHLVHDVSVGVVVLGQPDKGPFAPVAFWPESGGDRRHLAEIAERALIERHGLVLKRGPGNGTRDGALGFEIAYPIQIDGHLHGVVALEIGPRPEPELEHVMRQLQWGSGWLEAMQKRHPRIAHGGDERLETLLELVAAVVEHGRFQAAATAFVTELATRFDCERVSLGFPRRGRIHLRAVSHSAQFGKKTNLVRSIEAAMDETLDQESVLVYPAPEGAPFRTLRAHEVLSRQHGSGAVCSVPLGRNGSVVGVLTMERGTDTPFDPETVELWETLGALAGPILEVARREDRWLVTKSAESLWRQVALLFGPYHIVRKLVVICLIALVAFFATATQEYRVGARTIIEPVVKRAAVAPFAGYISESDVRAGDDVLAGDLLARLDDRDLRLERLKWLSQKQQYAQQYQLALAERDAARVKITQAQVAQADAELKLVEDRLERTGIRAPFDGMVVTGDLSQSIGSPVERGEVLFEVAPLNEYRVILEVDERDIAEVSEGRMGSLVLSTFPSRVLPLRIERITPVSTAREGRNYFRVEAHLEETPPELRPGMEGVAKVAAGNRLVLWIWTHRALDWLRLKSWSWLP